MPPSGDLCLQKCLTSSNWLFSMSWGKLDFDVYVHEEINVDGRSVSRERQARRKVADVERDMNERQPLLERGARFP